MTPDRTRLADLPGFPPAARARLAEVYGVHAVADLAPFVAAARRDGGVEVPGAGPVREAFALLGVAAADLDQATWCVLLHTGQAASPPAPEPAPAAARKTRTKKAVPDTPEPAEAQREPEVLAGEDPGAAGRGAVPHVRAAPGPEPEAVRAAPGDQPPGRGEGGGEGGRGGPVPGVREAAARPRAEGVHPVPGVPAGVPGEVAGGPPDLREGPAGGEARGPATAAAGDPGPGGGLTPADFDDRTPPPRRRPPGVPVGRFVELPRGESPIGWCAAMDQQGRIPAGSVLVQAIPARSGGGWKLWWKPGPAELAVPDLPAAGGVIPAAVTDRYEPRTVCWVRGEAARYTVMAPKEPLS